MSKIFSVYQILLQLLRHLLALPLCGCLWLAYSLQMRKQQLWNLWRGPFWVDSELWGNITGQYGQSTNKSVCEPEFQSLSVGMYDFLSYIVFNVILEYNTGIAWTTFFSIFISSILPHTALLSNISAWISSFPWKLNWTHPSSMKSSLIALSSH